MYQPFLPASQHRLQCDASPLSMEAAWLAVMSRGKEVRGRATALSSRNYMSLGTASPDKQEHGRVEMCLLEGRSRGG